MDTKEAALTLNVSERRVRALASSGRLDAHKTPHGWQIKRSTTIPDGGRPLSAHSRAALLHALNTRSLGGLTGQARVRTAARLRELRESEHPERLLVRWWGGQKPQGIGTGQTMVLRAQAGDARMVKKLLRPREEFLQNPRDLADIVASERAIARLSPHDLAEKAGVDIAEVRRIERGEGITSPGPARKILRTLGVHVSALPSIMVAR